MIKDKSRSSYNYLAIRDLQKNELRFVTYLASSYFLVKTEDYGAPVSLSYARAVEACERLSSKGYDVFVVSSFHPIKKQLGIS